MMKMVSAHFYYGTSKYEMHLLTDEFNEIPFAPIAEPMLTKLCEAISRASGILSTEDVMNRITFNIATEEKTVDLSTGPFTIPSAVSFLGNGFSIIWR